MKERRTSVEDAMNATRARSKKASCPAAEPRFSTQPALDKLKPDDPTSRSVSRSCARPSRPRASDCRERRRRRRVVAASCWKQKDTNFGFDAQTDKFEDLVKAGVIDPVKVVRIALQDAASVAGLLITTEVMVAEKPSKDGGMGGMPDMGGMGGMGGMM